MRRLAFLVSLLLGGAAVAQTIEPFVADAGENGAPGSIAVATIATQANGVGFDISGSYSASPVPTGIDWEADCVGSWAALSSPTIGAGAWTSTAADVVFSVNGTHTVCVREQTAAGITVASNSFTVSNSPAVITATKPGTLAISASYTQAGHYSGTGYTPAAIDYSFDGTGCASAAGTPTIGGGNISFTNTAPSGTGSHTITLCDHSTHSIFGTSASFTVNAAGYQGPLDVVAGATSCTMFSACSAAIAAGGTTPAVGLFRNSDTHGCQVVAASTGQLATTVSGCSTGGDNGAALATWASGTVYASAFDYSIQGLSDQSGNNRHASPANHVYTLTANCFTTLYCFSLPGSTNTTWNSAIAQSAYFPSGVFTIIAWVRPTTLTNAAGYSIVDCATCQGVQFSLIGQPGGATAKLDLSKQGVGSIGTSTCTITINAWHSIGVTYNQSSGAWAFYADGAPCGSGTNAVSLTLSGIFEIGGAAAPDKFVGDFRGIVTYGSVLSAVNAEAVEGTGP